MSAHESPIAQRMGLKGVKFVRGPRPANLPEDLDTPQKGGPCELSGLDSDPTLTYFSRVHGGGVQASNSRRPIRCWPMASQRKTMGHQTHRFAKCELLSSKGVTEGIRTPDPQSHNLMLYQLSYSHHRIPKSNHLPKIGQRSSKSAGSRFAGVANARPIILWISRTAVRSEQKPRTYCPSENGFGWALLASLRRIFGLLDFTKRKCLINAGLGKVDKKLAESGDQ